MPTSTGHDHIAVGQTPQLVVSRSEFMANPHGVLGAVSALADERTPPQHISMWHNYYCARSIMAVMVATLFLFSFVDSQSVFLGLAYLISGLFSLALQSCFGLVGRLDKSCGDSSAHIKLVQLCYIVGLFLWCMTPFYLFGRNNSSFIKAKNKMLESEYVALYFMGLIIASTAMGFIIILPATIINEVVMLIKTLFCCHSKSSYGALERSVTVSENPGVARTSGSFVQLASRNSHDQAISRERVSPARFERRDDNSSSPVGLLSDNPLARPSASQGRIDHL